MQFLVNIDVEDLARAERFYCAALGLTPGRRLGSDILELLGGTAPVFLLEKKAGTAATESGRNPRDYHRHWTPVHLDFVVYDIEHAVETALQAGAAQEGAISACAWGKLALMTDPFGNGFCLVQFIGRGYDEIVS